MFLVADALVNELKRLTLEKNVVGVESALDKLSAAENLQSVELRETFLELLLTFNTPNINLLLSKTIAEITKIPEQRTNFSSNDVLEKLMELLSSTLANRSQPGSFELIIQLCRALGNIFYANDDARNIIFHLDGGKILIELFNISNSEIQNTEELELFAKVRSGVMSNYLLGNEELSQKAIEFSIIDKMKARIEESNDGLEHLLPLFSILTEQVSDLTFSPDILVLITKILKNCTNSEVAEACLELLVCQAESDDVKLLLAREGLCEHIFKSHEKFKNFKGDVDTKSLIKLSCDLIVLILTGGKFNHRIVVNDFTIFHFLDDAMHFLDKTPLLAYMKTWLDLDDVDLLTTSILALGNFARTDEHCIRMVEDNMHTKLIEILAKHNGPDADVRLQHSLVRQDKLSHGFCLYFPFHFSLAPSEI